ncbi:lecithin retinol acyltransferase family protein [Synechococcus elongatus]|uniref:Lecithin retinol acyltransferase family protein n=2 Tax=Synechococcus elongatus TaxID=32046 RepID=A0AAN1QMM7_SYNEL|nr:lecithin retinol acyltransferase family protein [Synechococcus elongatus]AZB71975.1 hypothetical protein DOP62_03835 [Synechococcus elongatus PCC 11801]QFZ91647.1 hypothetical protein EKO22_03970 [Synechococcus elongatus PCC 11802]
MAQGDHLVVDRRGGLYTHHGIDIGDGTVVHYLEGETIVRTSKDYFRRGEQIRLRDYADCDPADITIERALSRLGEQRYNVLFNNCEHFATWCKTGRANSHQVERSLAVGAVGGLLLGGPLVLPALAAAGALGVQGLLSQAQQATDPVQAERLLQEARSSLLATETQLEQQLTQLQQEAESWQKTAQAALQRDREDLARAALEKRYPLKRQMQNLELQLTELRQLLSRI